MHICIVCQKMWINHNYYLGLFPVLRITHNCYQVSTRLYLEILEITIHNIENLINPEVMLKTTSKS